MAFRPRRETIPGSKSIRSPGESGPVHGSGPLGGSHFRLDKQFIASSSRRATTLRTSDRPAATAVRHLSRFCLAEGLSPAPTRKIIYGVHAGHKPIEPCGSAIPAEPHLPTSRLGRCGGPVAGNVGLEKCWSGACPAVGHMAASAEVDPREASELRLFSIDPPDEVMFRRERARNQTLIVRFRRSLACRCATPSVSRLCQESGGRCAAFRGHETAIAGRDPAKLFMRFEAAVASAAGRGRGDGWRRRYWCGRPGAAG